jgi:hypothetical protein
MARGSRSAGSGSLAIRFIGPSVRRADGCAQRVQSRWQSLASTFSNEQMGVDVAGSSTDSGRCSMRARMLRSHGLLMTVSMRSSLPSFRYRLTRLCLWRTLTAGEGHHHARLPLNPSTTFSMWPSDPPHGSLVWAALLSTCQRDKTEGRVAAPIVRYLGARTSGGKEREATLPVFPTGGAGGRF